MINDFTIHIIEGPMTGNESEALRQTLEYFGYQIIKSVIGRPADLKKQLNANHARFVILSVHGVQGKIVMPVLASNIYLPSEPRGDLAPKDLMDLEDLLGVHLITSGCSLSNTAWQNLWHDKQVSSFIGPSADIEGNSSLQFLLRLFYELKQHNRSMASAFAIAKGIDNQTTCFTMSDGA